MTDWYSGIYKGLLLSSVIAFIIGFFSSGNVSVDAYITGYSVLILGILMLLLILFNGIIKLSQNISNFELMKTILMTTGPFLLMLGVLGLVLYLLITSRSSIVENHVSQEYYSFSNITIILILLQLYIVYTNITDTKFEQTHKLSSITAAIMYLLGVLSSISSIIVFIILKAFTTDGFKPMN